MTVKIRSGWDSGSINAPEFARVLEAAGASAITVPPRRPSEHHRGEAAWSVIHDVKQAVSIPVVGNGDVRCPTSARSMIELTGADGIMIGRGALQNPWLFRQIATGSTEAPGLDDYRRLFERLVALLREHRPERLVKQVDALLGDELLLPAPGEVSSVRPVDSGRATRRLFRMRGQRPLHDSGLSSESQLP